jgi:hypothetical protein
VNGEKNSTFPGGSADPTGGLRAWVHLLLALAAVLVFMFVIAPAGLKLPGFKSMSALIAEKNIRATALYYTDIDEFGEAAATLRNNREYTPKGP